MGYETGSAASFGELLLKMKTFLAAQNWTITEAGLDKEGEFGVKSFYAQRGFCVAWISPFKARYWVNGAANTKLPTYMLRMGFGHSVPDNAALTTEPEDIPGGLDLYSSSAWGTYPLLCASFLTDGPFSAYHFFDDGDGFYAVLEFEGRVYHHISMGELDKMGLGHSGVGFVSTSRHAPYQEFEPDNDRSNSFSDPGLARALGTGAWGSGNSAGGNLCLRTKDCFPDGKGYPAGDSLINSNNVLAVYNKVDALDVAEAYNEPPHMKQSVALLDVTYGTPALPVGGATPMMAIPVFGKSDSNRVCYVGDMPNLRLVRVEHLAAGEEIALADDKWIVFPVYAKTPPSGIGSYTMPSSGYNGLAYKRID